VRGRTLHAGCIPIAGNTHCQSPLASRGARASVNEIARRGPHTEAPYLPPGRFALVLGAACALPFLQQHSAPCR
jgi:hypothetical protein